MQEEVSVSYIQSPVLDTFIAEVQDIIDREPDRAQTVQHLRPAFTRLLADKTWLPTRFTQPDPTGGMGEGVGTYLLYRSASRDLSLVSLVLPAGMSTPVHDHLAWGLVGLYSGEQEERVYRRVGTDHEDGTAHLIETEQRRLHEGDFYELLPPEGDIHQVHTLSDQASVSLHLLGSDIGCTWRHRYEPHAHRVYAFRSGYSNAECADTESESVHD